MTGSNRDNRSPGQDGPYGARPKRPWSEEANPAIPWERRRRERGFSFWKTVFWVLRRNGRIGEAMAHPVSYRESQRFRRATIWLAMLPVLMCILLVHAAGLATMTGATNPFIFDVRPEMPPLVLLLAISGATGIVLCPVALFLMTGVVSCFFWRRRYDVEQQRRAVALSHYTAAPLALLAPLLAILALAALAFLLIERTEFALALLELGLIALGVYWAQLAVAGVRDVTRRGNGRTVLAGLGLSALWAVIVVGLFFFVPATVTMWTLMFLSRA